MSTGPTGRRGIRGERAVLRWNRADATGQRQWELWSQSELLARGVDKTKVIEWALTHRYVVEEPPDDVSFPTGRSDYQPGGDQTGEPTPRHPDLFSSEDIQAEIAYIWHQANMYDHSRAEWDKRARIAYGLKGALAGRSIPAPQANPMRDLFINHKRPRSMKALKKAARFHPDTVEMRTRNRRFHSDEYSGPLSGAPDGHYTFAARGKYGWITVQGGMATNIRMADTIWASGGDRDRPPRDLPMVTAPPR